MTDMPEETDSHFGAWISMLNRAAQIWFSRELEPYRIGPGQQAYLLVVRPGETLTQLAIGTRLSMDKANVARAVQALVRAGYLTRTRPNDRRQWSVSLTSKGQQIRLEVVRVMQNWVAAIRQDIEQDDWETFVSTLARVSSRAMEHASGRSRAD